MKIQIKAGKFIPKIQIGVERWKYYLPLNIYVSNTGKLKDAEGKAINVCASHNYLMYKGRPVHRIVMACWKPVPGYESLTVDHLDHNTRNNSVKNLESKIIK